MEYLRSFPLGYSRRMRYRHLAPQVFRLSKTLFEIMFFIEEMLPKVYFSLSILLRLFLFRKVLRLRKYSSYTLWDHSSRNGERLIEYIDSFETDVDVKYKFRFSDLRELFKGFITSIEILDRGKLDPENMVRYFEAYFMFRSFLKCKSFHLLVPDAATADIFGAVAAIRNTSNHFSLFRVSPGSKRITRPKGFTSILCQTEDQYSEFPDVSRMVGCKQIPIRLIASKEVYSVALYLSSKFNLLKLRERVNSLFMNSTIIFSVRLVLHPQTYKDSFLIERIRDFFSLSDKIEIVKDNQKFSNDLADFAIVGNSSVAFDLVMRGLPVVYDNNIDDERHDAHGFVAQGLIIDCSDMPALSPALINDFYRHDL